MDISVSIISIPFKFHFSHATKKREKTSSILVEIKRGSHVGFGEGCPRDYVTGENITGAIKWIKKISNTLTDFTTIATLKDWVFSNESVINKHPSAWCAVETAFIDLIGKESGQTVNELLNIDNKVGNQDLTAVISDGDIGFIESLLSKYVDFGFTNFKIKLSGNLKNDLQKIDLMRSMVNLDHSVRADLNNAFSSKDINLFFQYFKKLNYSFFAIEEPFEPLAFSAMIETNKLFEIPIILDESFTKRQDIEWIKKSDNFIPNIRVSKLGGLLRALETFDLTKHNIGKFILGSHVGETSILTRLWLTVGAYCGNHICAREGAYSAHLLERDITEFPIILERFGKINYPESVKDSPGLGIDISPKTWKYIKRC